MHISYAYITSHRYRSASIIQIVGTVSRIPFIASQQIHKPSLKIVIDAQLINQANRRDPNKPLRQITLSATLETSFFLQFDIDPIAIMIQSGLIMLITIYYWYLSPALSRLIDFHPNKHRTVMLLLILSSTLIRESPFTLSLSMLYVSRDAGWWFCLFNI